MFDFLKTLFPGKKSVTHNKLNILFQKCNLACPMCSMNANNSEVAQILRDYPKASSGPELTLEEYKTVLKEMKKIHPSVSIAGGEPMLFPELVDLVAFSSAEMGFPTGITTNGTLFNDEILKRIEGMNTSFTISIDGMKEMHDSIRRPGSFDKTVNALRALVSLKEKGLFSGTISSLFVMHKPNYLEAYDVARFLLQDIGIDALTFSFLIFSHNDLLKQHATWMARRDLPPRYAINIPRGGSASPEDLRMDFQRMWNEMERIKADFTSARFEPDFQSVDEVSTYFMTNDIMDDYFNSFCRPSHSDLTLISNGDVLFFPGCFQIKVGNVREESIVDIAGGERMREIIDTLSSDLSPICAHCCSNRKVKNL